MSQHTIVSRDEWTQARKRLLEKEKEARRASDALAAERRELPWTRVEKRYVFDTEAGEKTLGDLFDGRSALVVYHFMFAPEAEAGCKSCSFWADSFDHIGPHLAARDATFLAISRAPLAKLAAFKKRLGWSFQWVSSGRTDFNADYHVAFDESDTRPASYNYAPLERKMPDLPGVSVFHRDERGIFHTYSTYARGIDHLNVAYQYLDLTPQGRNEGSLPHTQAWVRFRDQYDVRA